MKFREYFITAFGGTPYISDPSYSVITLRPALFFSSPVRDANGQVAAVVRTRVNLNAVWDLVEADAGSVGSGAHGFLVDDYGIRIAVSETKGHRDQADSLIYKPIAPIDPQVAAKLAADKRFGAKTPDQLVVDPLPELKTAMDTLKSAGSSMAFAYSLAGADQRGVTTRLRSKPWSYVLAVPLTDYTRAADDATVNAALTIAIGLLLSLLMAVVLTRSRVGPLRGLLHRATQVSTGDIDLREAYFDTQTGDDVIREVASAFDRMLTALRFYALADEDAALDFGTAAPHRLQALPRPGGRAVPARGAAGDRQRHEPCRHGAPWAARHVGHAAGGAAHGPGQGRRASDRDPGVRIHAGPPPHRGRAPFGERCGGLAPGEGTAARGGTRVPRARREARRHRFVPWAGEGSHRRG